jgi:hypothetical protein
MTNHSKIGDVIKCISVGSALEAFPVVYKIVSHEFLGVDVGHPDIGSFDYDRFELVQSAQKKVAKSKKR